MKVALVTCSYAPDRRRCTRLCESMDQFVATDISHVVIVPRRDHPRFAELASDRRQIIEVESLVPWTRQVPLTDRWWITPFSLPVRGWIMQQLVKLSVAKTVDADVFVFADSDVHFIRPFTREHVIRDGLVRLHRIPGMGVGPRHLLWNRKAAQLLGLKARDYFGNDYIGQLVSWRREVILELHARITKHSGRDWRRVLCNTLHFSEYILYGVFADHVVGIEAGGHFADEQDLCHCSWHHRLEAERDLRGFVRQLQPRHVAVLVQSYLSIPNSDAVVREELAVLDARRTRRDSRLVVSA